MLALILTILMLQPPETTVLPQPSSAASATTVTSVKRADRVCYGCHREITESYLNTPMANASGTALDRVLPGDLQHVPSGINYKVGAQNGSLWLTYSRHGDPDLQAKQQLQYFLGSGHLGVTYLYSLDGYLLESPVAYYADTKRYDMKPGLTLVRSAPSALPMASGCMRCHMSNVQPEDPGTRNHYRGLPFLHGGITCESCHGDAAKHVTGGEPDSIINPAKLSPDRRDSLCISCHLEGDTNVQHRGRSLIDFAPGERIQDYVSYFVYSDAESNTRGVSEIEQLMDSKCKRTSGDRMSCTSCHDPHYSPAPEERAGFYRARCLACHNEGKYSSNHHGRNPDCVSCHMPKGTAQNIPHVAWTDHRIRQNPMQSELSGLATRQRSLRSILDDHTSTRDLALAYANIVVDGRTSEAFRAWELLHSAEKNNVDDPVLLTALGYMAEKLHKISDAELYYQEALKLDRLNISATNNLASLLARRGELSRAASLWETLFALNEDLEDLGLNLANVYCKLGQRQASERVLQRVLVYSPDSNSARRDLRAIHSEDRACTLATVKP